MGFGLGTGDKIRKNKNIRQYKLTRRQLWSADEDLPAVQIQVSERNLMADEARHVEVN